MAVKTFGSERLVSTDINTYLANSGLVYVASGTLNLTTSYSNVVGVFSSTYKNYRVLLNITTRSTTNRFDMRYLVGTTPSTTSYYQAGLASDYASNAVGYFQRSNNDGAFFFDTTSGNASYSIDIMQPQVNAPTRHYGQTAQWVNPLSYSFGGAHVANAQHTGFQLAANTGTMTVEYQVFGYREG